MSVLIPEVHRMTGPYFYTSLTRIAPLTKLCFEVEPLPKTEWAAGDYVVGEVAATVRTLSRVERTNGRVVQVALGDRIVGAFGTRHATLEATGTWEAIGDDGLFHMLTSAGLFGRMTSKSPFVPLVMPLGYLGHVVVDGRKATMRQFVAPMAERAYRTPTILVVGTSMSAGKTTAARIVIRELKRAGLTVLGAKLSGAGRYRDILSMADTGADHVFDFVDVGLPSSVVPEAVYRAVLPGLLARMAGVEADAAVIEIGASPLEPYNGDVAFRAIEDQVRCTILCASDPYAVLGVMHAFDVVPDLVSGLAANTHAGVELVQRLCGVEALNLLDPASLPTLCAALTRALDRPISDPHLPLHA